jgi:RNA polymerase sigma factor (sigma-70 family)
MPGEKLKDVMTTENIANRKAFVISLIPNLLGFAMKLARNGNDAEELVSETLLKSLEKIGQVKDETKMKAWLFTMLHNLFMDKIRAGSKVRIVAIDEDFDIEEFSMYEELSQSSFVENGNPEVLFLQKILEDDIQAAINDLPDAFKPALILCDVEGFAYSQISEILNIPVGTVRSRIARARTLLQKKLWRYAQEMGIVGKIKTKENVPYECSCGEENNLDINIKESELKENINAQA